MHFRRFRPLCLAALAAFSAVLSAQEKADLAAVQQIRTEAVQNSKVMDTLFYLTDVHGPRLTGSPGYEAAAKWAVQRLQEYGLQNAHLEPWGPFGRGWEFTRYAGHMVEPKSTPLIGFPMAWTSGTNGPVQGEAIHAVLRTDEDLTKWKGKLKGKMVLYGAVRDANLHTNPEAKRYSENELTESSLVDMKPVRNPRDRTAMETARRFRKKLVQFMLDEGVLVAVSPGYQGDGGTVFAAQFGSQDAKDPVPVPAVAITAEHYNRIVRLLDHKIPVKLEFDIQARVIADQQNSFNVVAEIPGTTKKDEIVMLGAHLDSWHGGTGATDNATGSAVVMEAVRIIQSLHLKPARTIRIALWSGEEQGLLGSAAYVKQHFADRETMTLKPEHAKLAGYFNLDNGGGKVRGIYLQGNDMMRPIAEAWTAAFKDVGMSSITLRPTGGTDHLSFDAVGLPGFQFVQDPLEYATRTHHSNMDVYDRVQDSDLVQASAVMASFVYQTAMRDQLLPRKPLPKPDPKAKEEKEMPKNSVPSSAQE